MGLLSGHALTAEQRRDYLRERVSEWQKFGDICIDDIDVAVGILIRGYLRTLERMQQDAPNTYVTLEMWCDSFHKVLMEQPESVRKSYWEHNR